jgi:hypothetical protein
MRDFASPNPLQRKPTDEEGGDTKSGTGDYARGLSFSCFGSRERETKRAAVFAARAAGCAACCEVGVLDPRSTRVACAACAGEESQESKAVLLNALPKFVEKILHPLPALLLTTQASSRLSEG